MNWPFPAQLTAAFSAVGAHVEVLCPADSLLALSRHPARKHSFEHLSPMASLRRAIKAARPDLIVPCDDLATRLVRRVRGDEDTGRLDFLRQAAAAGAPVLPTIAIETKEALEDALQRFSLPLVIKSDHSWAGEGVAIVHTPEAARAAFRRLRRAPRLRDLARALRGTGIHYLTRALLPATTGLTLQRYVEGMPATSSIACWRGEVVGAHHFDVRLSTTPTSPASVLALADCPQMAQSAQAVARAFNLSGLFGLDYIRGHDGRVHLLEMNARATPTTHLALGDDLVAGLLSAAGFPARRRDPVTSRREIALFPREWLRDPASPWLERGYHDVPWDDPKVLQACLREAPAAAGALLQAAPADFLTSKSAVSVA